MDFVELHLDRVDGAIRAGGLSWDDWPGLAVEAEFAPDVRLSALLLLMAAPLPESRESRQTIEGLRRRRLPWDAATVALALRIVEGHKHFDAQRISIAVRAAQQVADAGNATEEIITRLRALRTVFTPSREGWTAPWSPMSVWRLPETLTLIDRALAATTPPGFLDLSIIRDGDAWAKPAREAARSASSEAVAALVRLLGGLGPGAPSAAWRRKAFEALADPGAASLLEAWLRLAADTEAVEPDDHAMSGFSGMMLFALGNEDLVRAAAFAAEGVDGAWVAPVLSTLALRGTASSGVPGATGALALAAGNAAITVLMRRDGPADRAALGELFTAVTRRDVMKRIGRHLGLAEDFIAGRDEMLRTTKAAEVSRKADPRPREVRAVHDRLIRKHLAPVLHDRGFTGRGRTFQRAADNRNDTILVRTQGQDMLVVQYWTRFATTFPPRGPGEVPHGQDVMFAETWGATPDAVAGLAARCEDVIVPFLDRLAEYESVLALARDGAGVPAGVTGTFRVESSNAQRVLGPLALLAGDRANAVRYLQAYARVVEEQLAAGSSFYSRDELDWYRGLIARAEELPDPDVPGTHDGVSPA